MSKGLIATLVVIGGVILIGVSFFFWGAGVYDSAVKLQEGVNESWGNVQASYQRRADLVPNLVATVKEAAENERGILTSVTQARAGITSARTPDEIDKAGKQINAAINLAFEAYPQIRSTENFQDLQAQLEGTEHRINVARVRYNETIKDYNSYVRGFFKRFALGLFGGGEDFSVKQAFSATEGAENAPSVSDAFKK